MNTPRSLLLPAGVRRERVATQRGRFAGLIAGSTGRVRGAVLLIPGFTGSKEDFAPLLPLLAAAGWWAVAYDQRGQYESPGIGVEAYTLEALAADASAIAPAAVTGGTRWRRLACSASSSPWSELSPRRLRRPAPSRRSAARRWPTAAGR